MNSLIDGAIDKSRMVMTILIFAIIAGTSTYINLPKESDPEIPLPLVGVTIALEGASPEDIERLIVRPAEAQLQTIEGITELSSTSAEGVGVLSLEFETTIDIDQALVDVREKIDLAKSDFPADALEPIITEVNTSLFPILVINLYGDVPERGLYSIARDLQDDLEAQPGVLELSLIHI